ncbi:hypothetical protein CHL78_002095 [Romboutsia weinsteinii]|uniref:DUF3784 domain-containing protein n=1 Tax=Romboutsia weinsteinii TaxID=2020949 RepID=A0A371J8N9_9FIRM|nr:hypothetical protein [Romboutsia weinsteinii]RDY29119.1 hypothetical protein CHL78_002095 [Romboutsia weinsteinii]
MNVFIIIGVLFIPCFIFYNLWCLKNRKVSSWIGNKHQVTQDIYFKFQFISCIFTCTLMALFAIFATISNLGNEYIVLLVILFHISISITKFVATKKNYISRI